MSEKLLATDRPGVTGYSPEITVGDWGIRTSSDEMTSSSGVIIFTRECNETSIAGGEKALTRSIAHSIL